jgi:NADPH-dependent curcumin reductase CurA
VKFWLLDGPQARRAILSYLKLKLPFEVSHGLEATPETFAKLFTAVDIGKGVAEL